MKRILFAIFFIWLAMPCTFAVDCTDGYFSVGENCIESKFQITTTELDANTTFSFYMSAKGTFCVDWGDGNTQTITRTNTTETLYSHTFDTAGTYTIQFGGVATGYTTTAIQGNSAVWNISVAAIRFYTGTTTSPHYVGTQGTELLIAGVSGSIGRVFPTISSGASLANQPRFNHLFFCARNIDCEIPENLFLGISGPGADEMFRNTFAYSGFRGAIPENLFPVTGSAKRLFGWVFSGCTKLTGSIPENLFNRARGAVGYDMFMGTFGSCTGLTGTIPENLFSGVYGVATYAFYGTFQGCRGLSGSIPAGLFSRISGTGKEGLFGRTFYNCSGLTGYVPPTLFAGVSSYGNNMMQNIFENSGLMTSCPCGTTRQTTQYDSYWSGKVACQKLGTGHYHNGQCVIECDNAGIGKLKTSTGLSFPILKTQIGEKSLAISHNDTTCYVPLAPGVGELNISYDGQVYHAFAPDEIEPE